MESLTISVEEKCFILSKIYQSIPLFFAHWEDALLPKEELDNEFQQVLQRALEMDNEKDFSLLMLEFMAKLNNGHTNFFPRASLYGPTLGVNVIPLNEEWIVKESIHNGLIPGDKILIVEGKTPDVWYDDLKRYIHISNPVSKKRQLFRLMSIILPEKFTLVFEDVTGCQKDLTINRKPVSTESVTTSGRWIKEKDIAYVKIPSFGNPEHENKAIDFLKQFEIAKTMIFDVRGNSGGSTPTKLIRSLMDRPYRWYSEKTPLNIGIHTLQAMKGWNNNYYDSSVLMRPPYQKPQEAAYGGHIIILTDKGTCSAAEDFTLPFKDNGRATIIGEATFGSSGQPFYYEFPNGMSFRISTKRAYFPDGLPFEGIGISPDIEQKYTREDLYENRDSILEKAIEFIDKYFA